MTNYYAGFCPACKSDNIFYPQNGLEHIFETDNLIIKAICADCKTTFDEVYLIKFYTNLITGKAIPEEGL